MPRGLDGNQDPVVTPERSSLLALVCGRIDQLDAGPRPLVAVDGASGVGKSTLADELAHRLGAGGRAVVRASIDSFHRPRAERYRQGTDSPEGYYRDSHDLVALCTELLDPFAQGAQAVRTAIFDEPSDRPVVGPLEPVTAEAILVFDGLFLHRPELVTRWDFALYLAADGRREAAWRDYLARDLPDDPRRREQELAARVNRARRRRYVEGQAIYEREADPLGRADIVIDNDDLARPRILGLGRSG